MLKDMKEASSPPTKRESPAVPRTGQSQVMNRHSEQERIGEGGREKGELVTGAFLGVTGRTPLLWFVANCAQTSLEAESWVQQAEEEGTPLREFETWFYFRLSLS